MPCSLGQGQTSPSLVAEKCPSSDNLVPTCLSRCTSCTALVTPGVLPTCGGRTARVGHISVPRQRWHVSSGI